LTERPDLDVLYEDHHLIAVNKPAGLPTQAPAGLPSLEATVKAWIKATYAKPAGVYLGVPHRLDRPVSGVVLFCRNTKAAQRVHAQFEARTVTKIYVATVAGIVTPATGTWTDWIRKVPGQAMVERAAEGEPGAKYAELRFEVATVDADRTTLTLYPKTGRTHQLRVQCAWRGHPIVGDGLYGSAEPSDDRIRLHARSLTIEHPFGKGALTIVASRDGRDSA
jgi:23S rRNA pseudouridine1911/1915/1917 synthase